MDRSDLVALIFTILGLAAALAYIALVPNAFNGSIPTLPVILLDTVLIYGYAAYWAFSIWHALAVPLYRRQALGIGFVILSIFGVFTVIAGTTRVLSLRIFTPLATFSFYLLFAVLFYWIDASILASRRSDPLVRDTLHWTKVRIPLWIANIILWAIPLVIISTASVSGNITLLSEFNNGAFPNSPSGTVLTLVYNYLPIILPIVGLIYLPAIAIRCKWDRHLRMHFAWFAPAALFALALFLPLGNGLPGVVIAITGFSLYKSVRSLVPINKILRL